MKIRTLRNALSVLVVVVLLGGTVSAQLPQTRLTSLFPAGAQLGTTVDVTVTGGTDLDEVDQLIFSHAGIAAARKLDSAGNPVASAFVVTVGADVPPGLYDVRARGLFGISNPRAFRIDTLPEISETEPNNTREQASVAAVNSIVNARSNGNADVDYFRINVEAGQTIVIRCEAARLDSVMQPTLQLFDSSGRRVTESRRVFGQDPGIVFTSDQAQDLWLKVTDIVYAGGVDYVYRIAVDTRPLVDLVLPPLVSRSRPTTVSVFGRHLPGGQPSEMSIGGVPLQQLQIEIPAVADAESQTGFAAFTAPLSAFWWTQMDGNLIALSTSEQTATLAVEQTGDQLISVPAEVVGQFAAVGDEDSFRFEGKKGDSWVIDVFAHRLGINSDPLLMVEQVVVAADGSETFKRLATEDDNNQNPGGADLPTLSTDPSFQLSIPEDGLYRIRVRDRFADSRGDPRMLYRVAVRRPEPDFRLVVFDAFPSADGKAPPTAGAVSLRKGGSYPLTVYAYRQDGHNAAIQVEADLLPEGVSCKSVVIGPGQTAATLVFMATEAASELAKSVQIIGRSGPPETAVTRPARVATLVHDAVNGLPRTARMSDSLVVGVMKDEQPFSILLDLVVVDLSQDQQLLIPVTLQRRGGFDGKVDFTFVGVPANVDAPAFSIDKGSDAMVARLFIKENAPVSTSTIVISGAASVPYRRNPWLAERAAQQVRDAEALLAMRQQMATDTAAALTAAMQGVTAANERVAALMTEIVELGSKQQAIRDQFAKAVADYQALITELENVREKLASGQASKDGSTDEYEKALKAITEGAVAAEAASVRVAALSAQTKQFADSLTAAKKTEAEKQSEKTAMEEKLPGLKKAAEDATAAVAAAQKVVEQAAASKAAADEAAKKADEATKVNNVNLRAVSPAIVLGIQPAPGKVTAQVPDNGALKKGGSLTVKVNVARKNNYTGTFQVGLVLPAGIVGVSAEAVLLAADQTEVNLTIAADSTAVAGDIANAVIQATGDFNGRTAAVDVPAAIKVVE